MTLKEIFAKNLKRIRKSKNLSIDNLSHISGLSAKFIMDAEQGRATVYLDDVERICDALNVSEVDLIKEEE